LTPSQLIHYSGPDAIVTPQGVSQAEYQGAPDGFRHLPIPPFAVLLTQT
jgi:hypothetical protein